MPKLKNYPGIENKVNIAGQHIVLSLLYDAH